MGKFDGKVVLITGGARGQGRSHAVTFAREGAEVAFCDISAQLDSVPYPMSTQDDMKETVGLVEDLGRRCLATVADVRDRSQLDAFAEQTRATFGHVDFLLANAGIYSFSTVAAMDEHTWRDVIDTNLTGVFHAVRAVLPAMLEQRFGRIVATSSMAGRMGIPNIAHYCAAKWGLIGLIKSLAREVGAHGITANVVCPTNVDTDMIHNDATYRLFRPDLAHPTREDVVPAFQSLTAMPVPWVESIDVSNAVAFLCSEQARYITGETLSVAAGQNAGNAG